MWSNGALASHTSAASSRHLSASILDSPLRVFLFYENINGSITILRNTNSGLQDPWVDVTNDIRGHISTEMVSYKFRAPFSSLAYKNQLAIYLATESDNALSMLICDGLEICATTGFHFRRPLLGNLRDLDIKIARINIVDPTGIWTNSSAQKLEASDTCRGPPESPFHFSRIAAISSNASMDYFPVMIYHQLTESVLVEEIWHFGNGIWLKNNITI